MRRALLVFVVLAGCGQKSKPPPPAAGPPSSPEADALAEFERGQAAWRSGDERAALDAWRRTLEIDPRFMLAWLRYREAAQQSGRGDEVTAEFRAQLAKNPKDPLWLVLVATTERSRDEAVAKLKEAIAGSPEFPWSHYVMASALFEDRHFDEALRSIDRALALDSRSGSFHFLRGGILAASEKTEDALAAFRKAGELMPGDERPHVGAAQALIISGRTEEAVAELESAIAKAPASKAPRAFLHDVQMKVGRMALKEFSELHEAQSWGAALDAAERASAALERARALDASDTDGDRLARNAATAAAAAWAARAGASAKDRRPDEALAHAAKAEGWLQRASGIESADRDSRDYLAEGWLRLGVLYLGAGESLKERGSADAAAGAWRRARGAFEACLKVDPENRSAPKMVAEAARLLGE
jgi:tetratricopeptide (TPR) repeat protein